MDENADFGSSKRTRRRPSPIIVLLATNFIDATGFGIVILLLPFYVAVFKTGPSALAVLVASYSAMQFVFSPILGRISDNVGRRPVLLLSILVSSVSFIFFGLANSFFMLLLSRMIAGIATETAVAQAYIADITSKDERATGIGRLSAANGAGIIVGPAMGGFLSIYGFWASGLAAAILCLLNSLLVFLFLPESVHQACPKIQASSATNSIDLRKVLGAFSKPLMSSVLTILFIMSLAFSAIPVILPLVGMSFFDLGTVEMSYFFVYIGLIQIVLQGFIVGKLAKKFGEEKLMALGSLFMVFGLLFMALIPNITVFLALVTIMMLGSGMIQTAVPSFISRRTPASEQGAMLGVADSVSSIARVPGPLVGGLAFEFAGIVAPFFLNAALLLVALFLGVKVHFQVKPKLPDIKTCIQSF